MIVYQIKNNISTNEDEKRITYWKNKLIKTKKKIAKIRSENKNWENVTMRYELVYFIKRVYNTESPENMASIAYFKLFEMLNFISQYHIFTNIKLFDNAAMPGDFINCINDYYDHIEKFDWMASSYIPTNGDDDYLTDRYFLLEDYPKNWTMNDNNNGDILNMNNIEDIKNQLDKLNYKPNIYTSDLGIEFKNRLYEEDEYKKYNYNQILLGLKILDKHGVMIIKQFNIFEKYTRSLISNLSLLFEKVFITKPISSKPDNSESYLICINYNGEYKDIFGNTSNIFDISSIIEELVYSQINKINLNISMFNRNQSVNFYYEAEEYLIKLKHDRKILHNIT